MQGDVVKKMAKIVARDAYLLNCDKYFVHCKHCRAGYAFTHTEALASCEGGKDVWEYIAHRDDCIVVGAKKILDAL